MQGMAFLISYLPGCSHKCHHQAPLRVVLRLENTLQSILHRLETHDNSHTPRRAHIPRKKWNSRFGMRAKLSDQCRRTCQCIHFIAKRSGLMGQCRRLWWSTRLYGLSLPSGPLHLQPPHEYFSSHTWLTPQNITRFLIFNAQPSHCCSVYSFSPVCRYFPVRLFV